MLKNIEFEEADLEEADLFAIPQDNSPSNLEGDTQ